MVQEAIIHVVFTKKSLSDTVRTLLERMEEKGWITHREDGRTFLYSAAQIRYHDRMALGNPLSCLQQAFARLLARFHKKSLCFRSSFVGARFDAAGAVAYSVVCNRPEHRCYQVFPVRWRRPSQRLLECRHRLKSPLEADQSRLFAMRLGRLGCHASYQVIH